MGLSPLAKKLLLHKAARALVVNPPEGYAEGLGELPEGLTLEQRLAGRFDFVHLFVKDRKELDASIERALHAVTDDGIFWISYPKGGSGVETDLNRDKLWKALAAKGIRPVTQISVDPVWSAMRFRRSDKVGR